MLGAALVALTLFAFLSIRSQRARLEQRVVEDVYREVGGRVEGWEERLRDGLDQWLDTAANGDRGTAPLVQERLRSRHAWFDSLYIWVPPDESATPGQRKAGQILFPEPGPVEDSIVRGHPCVRRTQAIATLTRPSLDTVARMYVDNCAGAPLSVRVYTHGEAAQLYGRSRDYDEALTTLEEAGLPLDFPLDRAASVGLTPFLIVVHRMRMGSVLGALGRLDEAVAIWETTSADIATLDAPAARDVLGFEWELQRLLQQHATAEELSRTRRLLSRAARRALAWDEVQRRIVPQSALFSPTDGRFAYDQYQDTPYILYYSAIPTPDPEQERAGAIVLDQPSLLRDFLAAMGSYAPYIEITDANGTHVAGAVVKDPALRQSFPGTLTHLRITVSEQAITSRLGRFGGQYYTFLGALSIFVLIGFAGLIAQARASRRQRELLDRQREFTARITHELKTPLAGIRVTAENLEIGAYRDKDHLAEMATRIMNEADRLTARVEEILTVSREHTIPAPEVFDVEDLVLDALGAWGPRYAAVGVKLHADLHVTDEVKGDPVAVRDAVSSLLDNALKYRNEARSDCAVWISLIQKGHFVLIEVDDNGLGVPSRKRKSIFKEFVRVEGPNRGKAGGHGLGLAQVMRVAKAHHGTVVCTDSRHGGARFVLRLRAHA